MLSAIDPFGNVAQGTLTVQVKGLSYLLLVMVIVLPLLGALGGAAIIFFKREDISNFFRKITNRQYNDDIEM